MGNKNNVMWCEDAPHKERWRRVRTRGDGIEGRCCRKMQKTAVTLGKNVCTWDCNNNMGEYVENDNVCAEKQSKFEETVSESFNNLNENMKGMYSGFK